MAIIKCVECGKEFSDKASACPECGCPTEYSVDSNNATSDSDGFVEQDSIVEDETEESTTNISDTVKDFAGKALASWNDRNHATSKVNVIKVDEQHRTFQIKGYVPKPLKGALAVSTLGMSSIISSSVNSAGANNWYNFDDLVSYELLADDSVVVSGGVGQALIGGLTFGGAGAIAGDITGKRKQKKKTMKR